MKTYKLAKKQVFNEFEYQLNTLYTFPFFEEKYNIVRKLPLKKFPYTVHFIFDEFDNKFYISAIISDYQNPSNTRIKF